MKSIRLSDGLIVGSVSEMAANPGRYVNYWGPKGPGEHDTPPPPEPPTGASEALAGSMGQIRELGKQPFPLFTPFFLYYKSSGGMTNQQSNDPIKEDVE